MHAFPSLHAVPFDAAGLEHVPLLGSQVPAAWHWSLAAHVTAFDPAHEPLWQVSVCVHALPSLQVVPSASAGFEQVPEPGSHLPAAWHWSSAAHVTGFALVHAPLWQLSVCVHALPSLHALPSAMAGLEQAPVAGLHVPVAWHWSSATHVTGLAPVHVPFWQLSLWVQALPSSQAVPLLAGVCVQVPPEHASVVQGLPSSQEPEQVPPPASEPKPSSQVTVAPEFMTICAAASAPTNLDVLTVTRALVATRSAWSWAPELREMLEVPSK